MVRNSNTAAVTSFSSSSSNQQHERRVSKMYDDIPEARNLIWYDAYFDNDSNKNNIVAVFDLDYEGTVSFEMSRNMIAIFGVLVFISVFVGGFIYIATDSLPRYYFYLAIAIVVFGMFLALFNSAATHARHIAITCDGILYVVDQHSTICGRVGTTRKTILFEKITSCEVIEPGSRRIVSTVHIDTASRVRHIDKTRDTEDDDHHELTINGLKNATTFENLLLAMKRRNENHFVGTSTHQSYPSAIVNTNNRAYNSNNNYNNINQQFVDTEIGSIMQQIERSTMATTTSTTNNNNNHNDNNHLLFDIRKEMMETNRLLRISMESQVQQQQSKQQ